MTLRQRIRAALHNIDPMMHTARGLIVDVQCIPGKNFTVAEFQAELRRLELDGQVTGITSKEAGEAKYKLTDAGRATYLEEGGQ